MKVKKVKLPNGIEVFCYNKKEAQVIYKQVQSYVNFGVTIKPGNIVFDIGANIGIFSLWIYQVLNQDVSIYAFEPIPSIFEILKLNSQKFNPRKINVFPYGLYQSNRELNFYYYPKASAISTIYPYLEQEREKIKKSVLSNLDQAPAEIKKLLLLPPSIRSLLLDYDMRRRDKFETFTCPVKTLSTVINELKIKQIDLLKIDVEKSEMDILLGIEKNDWSKVKQVTLEVHDIENRLMNIKALLAEQGFRRIEISQEPIFKEADIFNVYAIK